MKSAGVDGICYTTITTRSIEPDFTGPLQVHGEASAQNGDDHSLAQGQGLLQAKLGAHRAQQEQKTNNSPTPRAR